MKYMGSKARIAKHILPIILENRQPDQWYVEPFVGGANIISLVDGNRLGSDSHMFLIEFLEGVRKGWQPPKNIDKDLYDKVRKDKHCFDPILVGCIGFCFTYASKYFGGFIGNSKDVVCKGRDRIGESYRAVEKARKQVQGINLQCCNYFDLVIPPNSIIYCDPPYKDTTGYKDRFDHDLFWDWCRAKVEQGHKVFVSEYNAPNDFECVWSKEQNSSLTKNTGGKKGTEKLFILNERR